MLLTLKTPFAPIFIIAQKLNCPFFFWGGGCSPQPPPWLERCPWIWHYSVSSLLSLTLQCLAGPIHRMSNTKQQYLSVSCDWVWFLQHGRISPSGRLIVVTHNTSHNMLHKNKTVNLLTELQLFMYLSQVYMFDVIFLFCYIFHVMTVCVLAKLPDHSGNVSSKQC